MATRSGVHRVKSENPAVARSETQNRKRNRAAQSEHQTPIGNQRDQAGPSNAPNNRANDPEVQQMHVRIDKLDSEATMKLQRSDAAQQRVQSAAAAVARYMLFKWQSAPHIPVSYTHLSDLIHEKFTHQAKRGTVPVIIALAQAKIAAKFGLEMQEVVSMSTNLKKKDDSGGRKSYILKTLLPNSFRDKYLSELAPPMDYELQGLLCVIMCLININDGRLSEEEMWKELSVIGLEKGQPHAAFGKVEEAIDTFVKQKLLRHEKKPGGPNGMADSWYEVGDHAKVLVNSDTVVDVMKQVLQIQQP